MKNKNYHIGIVKWYGGYNSKTERENQFGFIQSMSAEDIFVHKNEIKSDKLLSKDDIIIFEIGIKDNEKFARNVLIPSIKLESLKLFLLLLKEYEEEYEDFFNENTFKTSLKFLLKDQILEQLTEKDFCYILLELFERNNQNTKFVPSDIFFRKIDNFICIKKEINDYLSSLLCNYINGNGTNVILCSSELGLYLSNDELKKYFFENITGNISLITLRNENFLSKITEEDFCIILSKISESDDPNISSISSDAFFSKIDKFVSIKNNVSKKLSALICKNFDKINIRDLLNSSNQNLYFSNIEIKKAFSNIISASDINFVNTEIYLLLKYDIFAYDSFVYNDSFINYAFEHYDQNLMFFDVINSHIKNDPSNINRFLSSIKETKNFSEIFSLSIFDFSIIDLLENGVAISLIPQSIVSENENIVYEYINSLNLNLREIFINQNFIFIPNVVLLASIISCINVDDKVFLSIQYKLRKILENYFRGIAKSSSEFLRQNVYIVFKDINKYLANRHFKELIEPLLFKYLLFKKNLQFKPFFDNSIKLKNSLEYFILSNLFHLILAENNLDTAYEVFQKNLWDVLKEEIIRIDDKSLFKLFPQCNTMGELDLSCEAFSWNKNDEDKFLCRNKLCKNPQVLPDSSKHFLEYNIYDWFHLYGIDYQNADKPSKQDFPIKLAGYFNRLKEIYEVLKCRKCSSIMIPNMSYARNTEYYEYDKDEQKIVRKQLTAAYRVTVFRCINNECSENGNEYYINHCLGSGCYKIIDSRDLTQRCQNNRYICSKCGSCCKECAQTHPNGFCPECGHPLTLFEKNGRRFIYCSNSQCTFKIPTNDLTKKFFLPNIPVRIV